MHEQPRLYVYIDQSDPVLVFYIYIICARRGERDNIITVERRARPCPRMIYAVFCIFYLFFYIYYFCSVRRRRAAGYILSAHVAVVVVLRADYLSPSTNCAHVRYAVAAAAAAAVLMHGSADFEGMI